MKRLTVLTCIMLLGTVCAWAQDENSPKTSCLTSVTVAKSIVDSKFCYDFTVTNNSDPDSPFVDSNGTQYLLLVDKLVVDPAKVLPNPLAANVSVPNADWSWTDNGFERFFDTQSDKYEVPPSVAPGSTLAGFRYCYDTDPLIDPNDFTFTVHVLAVDPTFTYADPPANTIRLYEGISVDLPGYEDQPSWYDDPCRPPAVPEASSVLLGAMGLVGPIAMKLRRTR